VLRALILYGGVDGARTRDLLRDRESQAFRRLSQCSQLKNSVPSTVSKAFACKGFTTQASEGLFLYTTVKKPWRRSKPDFDG